MKTEADKEWEHLVNMPDEAIDFSDIPETTAETWKNAVVGKFYRPASHPPPVPPRYRRGCPSRRLASS